MRPCRSSPAWSSATPSSPTRWCPPPTPPARGTSGEARMTQALQSPPRPLAIRAPKALSHGPVHPVYLTGLRDGTRATDARPAIVERRDQEFVQGLQDDLADPG